MTSMFARALGLAAPSLPHDCDEALRTFAEFSAHGAQSVLAADDDGGTTARQRLEALAFGLVRLTARLPLLRQLPAEELTRAFYRAIGIDFAGALPGAVRMGPCYFSAFYTPQVCLFMSAFDQGAMRGALAAHGHSTDELRLVFEQRITQGAPACLATLAHR